MDVVQDLQNKTVLIVEDNPKNMKLTGDIVRSLGMKAIEAMDAETGLEIARRQKPDLILMDIQLPGMSGVEAIKILKNGDATRHIPIVAVTASAMDGDREKIMSAGCDWYISKPFNLYELTDVLKRFLVPSSYSDINSTKGNSVQQNEIEPVIASDELA